MCIPTGRLSVATCFVVTVLSVAERDDLFGPLVTRTVEAAPAFPEESTNVVAIPKDDRVRAGEDPLNLMGSRSKEGAKLVHTKVRTPPFYRPVLHPEQYDIAKMSHFRGPSSCERHVLQDAFLAAWLIPYSRHNARTIDVLLSAEHIPFVMTYTAYATGVGSNTLNVCVRHKDHIAAMSILRAAFDAQAIELKGELPGPQ